MTSKKFLIKLVDYYQKYISVLRKKSCVFYPTCSQYAKEAINKYGVGKGSRLALLRVLRCHPWQKKHIDPLN